MNLKKMLIIKVADLVGITDTEHNTQNMDHEAKVKMTKFLKKVVNYAVAVTKYALSGGLNVDESTYEHRVSICNSCDLNYNGECGLCGCPIDSKALWATEECPDKKWPSKVEEVKDAQKKATSGLSANRQYVKKAGCAKCNRS